MEIQIYKTFFFDFGKKILFGFSDKIKKVKKLDQKINYSQIYLIFVNYRLTKVNVKSDVF